MSDCDSQPDDRSSPKTRAGGFSIVELLVTIGIIAILMSILVPVLTSVRASQRSVQCITNLHNIGSAFHSYALENDGRLPDPGVGDQSWEQLLFAFYTGSFQCPSDEELFPAVGSSYDWRDTGQDSTTMAGKLLADVRRPDAVLAMESLSGWHAKGKINVVRIDGSAATIPEEECFKDLSASLRPGN